MHLTLVHIAAKKVTKSDQVDTPAAVDLLARNSRKINDNVNLQLPALIDAGLPQ